MDTKLHLHFQTLTPYSLRNGSFLPTAEMVNRSNRRSDLCDWWCLAISGIAAGCARSSRWNWSASHRNAMKTKPLNPIKDAKLSIRTQLAGTVREVVRGSVVSEVIVETAAGTLASVITTRSVDDLALKKGDAVSVMVKATEASIQKA